MVSLYTNQPAFFADIADELRLFLAMEEIVPAEACGAYPLFWKRTAAFGAPAQRCASAGKGLFPHMNARP